MKQKNPLVVTISRQLGSGGAYIGQQIARRMDMLYADREILREAAKKFSMLESDIEHCDEKIISFWQSLLKASPFSQNLYIPPKIPAPGDIELFETEAEIIESLAHKHSAVIIGRCGFHVLRDFPNRVSILIHADAEFRCERIQKLYNLPKEAALKMIAQSDKDRAVYCKTITGKEWTDVRNFHLAVETGKVGIDKTVELLISCLKSMRQRE